MIHILSELPWMDEFWAGGMPDQRVVCRQEDVEVDGDFKSPLFCFTQIGQANWLQDPVNQAWFANSP